MNNGSMVRLVAGREFSTRVKGKGFVISTAIMILVVLAISVLIKLASGSDPAKVGVVDGALGQPLTVAAQTVGEEIETRPVTQADGERLVKDGDLDALVLTGPLRVVVKKDLDDGLRNALNVMARQGALNAELVKAGADPAAVEQSVAAAGVQVTSIEGGDEHKGQRVVLAMVIAFLLYIMVMVSGLQVAQGVVEEKASRIVEILLSSLRPWQLMFGKVLGIGSVSLLQMTTIAIAGVAGAAATDVLDIPSGDFYGAAVWGLVWFVVGFALYALLFAAAGALVSRQEELGSVSGPIQMLILIPYILSFSLVPANPDGMLVKVLSYVPFFAPVLMPVRAAFGAPVWNQIAGLGVALVGIAVMVWLSGRVYENSILRTGSRIKLTEALKRAK